MLLNISKFFYVMFVFYIIWFQTLFFPISSMSLLLGSLMIIFLIFHLLNKVNNKKVIIPLPLIIWGIFAVHILLSGFFVATNIPHLFSSWFTYVQNLFLIFYIINISKIDGNNGFFQKTFWLLTVIYLLSMFFWGVERAGGRISLSDTTNPNIDGLILLLGIFFTLYYSKSNYLRNLLSIILISLYTYMIILTGSRTTFIGLAILVILWTTIIYRRQWIELSVIKKVIITILLVSAVFYVIVTYLPIFKDSTLYYRLTLEGGTGGDSDRIGMYNEAFKFFERKPLSGIGFNHFSEHSVFNVYSHSTYAEIISTTGLIGTILYFIPYLIIIYNILKIYLNSHNYEIANRALKYLILMIVMLVLGTVRIHFYGINDSILLALMISFYLTTKSNLKNV